MELQRTAAGVVVMLTALIAATLATVKVTTNHLLYEDATSTARNWARYVAENVKDLEFIARGEQPSSSSMAFFQWAQSIGLVFRYEIFNRDGYTQLVSDRQTTALVDLSEFSEAAATAVRLGRPVVAVREGNAPHEPAFFSKAYIPVMLDDGRTIAVVAAHVDQTELRDQFYSAFLIAAALLCLLTSLAFVVPAAAWYRRTKEKERADEHIRYLAHHDVMTGLDNRFQLTEKLQRALVALPERGGKLALHYVDLDRFKEVNDTLGHEAGDSLIQLAAERLRTAARRKDVVARIGGDEFTIVQTDVGDKSEAEALAQRVIAALSEPFMIDGQTVAVGASVGVATAPGDGIDMVQLMRRADLALYKAKTSGRNRACFFTPQLDIENNARFNLEQALRKAVATDGFDLHFQPVFRSTDKSLVGFEALCRLPPLGEEEVTPTVFIPVAEELDLIGPLGRWVLREACRRAVGWPEPLTVSVNLSPVQFRNGVLCDSVTEALRDSGLDARRLELEVTERLLLGDTEKVMDQLTRLKQLGVSIVMDDFGTGYSSLSYLWRFHFDKIKIDRSFITAYDQADADAETIIKTIVALGRSLNTQVTVEGVETDRQARLVRNLDADQVQGFYFGRPMPASDIGAVVLADFQRAAMSPDMPAQAPKTALHSKG